MGEPPMEEVKEEQISTRMCHLVILVVVQYSRQAEDTQEGMEDSRLHRHARKGLNGMMHR